MNLYNKSIYNLSHGEYTLKIGETKEIPNDIAKLWMNIQGIVEFKNPQEAKQREKELLQKIDKLEEKIKQVKQTKENATKTKSNKGNKRK